MEEGWCGLLPLLRLTWDWHRAHHTAVSLCRVDHGKPFPLLHLPDPCLLMVLQSCSDEPRSLFNAARAHSRLHQAAVLAASSIRVTRRRYNTAISQIQLDSMLLYLDSHGKQVSSLEFEELVGFDILRLPHSKLQGLSSLTISGLDARLQIGCDGIVAPSGRQLLIGVKELGTALAALPGLQHLSVKNFDASSYGSSWAGWRQHAVMSALARDGCLYHFPSDALQGLQQLTYLELVNFGLQDKDGMQQLQGLTRLEDLRLHCCSAFTLDSSMLSASQQLTCLELCAETELSNVLCKIQPAVLAGRTQLRHLKLMGCTVGFGGSENPELLSHLQQLQQLTYLSLRASLEANDSTPAIAYSALTSSSKLQLLDLNYCSLPEGTWQHVFPSGRQLPHLQELDISRRCGARSAFVAAPPQGSRLVSCCPGLRSLQMKGLQYSAELLAPLAELSSLRGLSLGHVCFETMGLDVVCQLTGLEQLLVCDSGGPATRGLMLQLSQLQRLTQLDLCAFMHIKCRVQVGRWLHCGPQERLLPGVDCTCNGARGLNNPRGLRVGHSLCLHFTVQYSTIQPVLGCSTVQLLGTGSQPRHLPNPGSEPRAFEGAQGGYYP